MRGHREQPQHVEQHLHVPAGHHQRRRAARQVRHGGSVLGDHIALARPPRVLEGRTGLPHTGQVLVVDEPDDGLRVGPRRAAHGVVAVVPGHLAQPAQRGVEPELVQRAVLAQRPPVLPFRVGVGGVAGQDVVPARMQPQVPAAAAEQRVELAVVGFALLPAGRHRRDRRRQVERPDDGTQGGAALRTEDERPHRACTCTLRPTSSSMPRSVS
jgi:hypothetical protein